MSSVTKSGPVLFALVLLSWSASALADPPAHAPANGWRKQHDPYYVGYSGRRWDRDYGISTGRCNREAVATVLGGVIGGAVGSKVSNDENRTIAIIVGAAAGALIGNRIGREIDAADRSCVGHALEVGQPGQVVTWRNPDTGVEYQMALGTNDGQHGANCREYILLGIAGDEKSFRRGVACQAEPGVWKMESFLST